MSDSYIPEGEMATQLGDQRMAARFCLKKSLGVGGMGEVYLAEDSTLRRLVAIKSVRPDLCKNPEIRKRIERECLLHAKVGAHPHIVTLYDKLEDGDHINLVMEYVPGETLQEMLERHAKEGTTPPLPEALAIATQCLEALSRIHAQGIVHRDIKPSNIILSRDDAGDICAKLMDFGIARAQDDEFASRLTQESGSGPGTPLYMSPEQIDPQTFGDISPATDVYAMGIMLYQMTSGEPPFFGTLTQIFSGHLHGTPPPLSERAKGRVPDSLVEIVHCALAKRPDQRFPTARLFRDELLRAGTDVPSSACSTAATSFGAATATDPHRTMAASSARPASPGSTVLGGAAVAGPGSTMLSGGGETGATVRRKRKIVRAAVAAVAVVMMAGGGAMVYSSMGSDDPGAAKAETTEPASAPSQAPAPATTASTVPAPTPAPATPDPVVNTAATPPVPDASVTPPPADTAAAPAPTPADPAPGATVPASVTPSAPPAIDMPPSPPANLDGPAEPPKSSGSALDALNAKLDENKANEPATPAPDVAPAAVTPDVPKAADPPARPVVEKKAKPARKSLRATSTAKPKTEPAPAAPAPAPVAEKPKSASSGGWGVKSETTYKKE